MMTRAEVKTKIDEMDANLKQTMEDLKHSRGVVQDVLRVVVPIMQEQLDIMKGLYDSTEFSVKPE